MSAALDRRCACECNRVKSDSLLRIFGHFVNIWDTKLITISWAVGSLLSCCEGWTRHRWYMTKRLRSRSCLRRSRTAGESQEHRPDRSIIFCSLRPDKARRQDLSELYQVEYCGVACSVSKSNCVRSRSSANCWRCILQESAFLWCASSLKFGASSCLSNSLTDWLHSWPSSLFTVCERSVFCSWTSF